MKETKGTTMRPAETTCAADHATVSLSPRERGDRGEGRPWSGLRRVFLRRLRRRPSAQPLPHAGGGASARPAEAGFTLTEVTVTILIIGLLSTIVLVNVLPSRDAAMVEKARTDVRTLEQALEYYRLDMLAYPSTEDGLEALVSAPAGHPRAGRYREGGYIKRLPDDPWGHPYQYAAPGEHGAIDIYSFGADGRPDGEGLDADIGNWS